MIFRNDTSIISSSRTTSNGQLDMLTTFTIQFLLFTRQLMALSSPGNMLVNTAHMKPFDICIPKVKN